MRRNPAETEVLQAALGVLRTVGPVVAKHPEYAIAKLIERICEPERQIIFRVPWIDDKRRGARQPRLPRQFNSALGPYKGGLRFHPSVNLGIVKFLGFEQVFKNALTGMPIGGGKGGSDFDPKGRSDGEIMRFCQSFMTELTATWASTPTCPRATSASATREIGYLFGQYKRITNRYESGVLTGKGLTGAARRCAPRPPATAPPSSSQEMLRGARASPRRPDVSSSPAPATSPSTPSRRSHQLGGHRRRLLGLHAATSSTEPGIDLDLLKRSRRCERGRIHDYADAAAGATVRRGRPLWDVPCRRRAPVRHPERAHRQRRRAPASPTACLAVAEGANMPRTPEAIRAFRDAGVAFAPGKAANAGGVATCALEMQQNASRDSWSFEHTEQRLDEIMRGIHDALPRAAEEYGSPGDYVLGANIAGFVRVADAMLALGVI